MRIFLYDYILNRIKKFPNLFIILEKEKGEILWL